MKIYFPSDVKQLNNFDIDLDPVACIVHNQKYFFVARDNARQTQVFSQLHLNLDSMERMETKLEQFKATDEYKALVLGKPVESSVPVFKNTIQISVQ